MSSIDELREERIEKLRLLKEKGIDPFPAETGRTHRIADVHASFQELENSKTAVTVDGRVMAKRLHGGSAFVDVFDGSGTIQLFMKKDEIGEEQFDLFEQTIDIGDFIEATGTPFVTKRGEESILASGWRVLTKSLRPLPEKWHGLKDVEERFRKRYLDLLTTSELREMVRKKARFWDETRRFMNDRGFLEVETPTLEITTGGAEARPFTTHHNDFDLDVYLRISIGELWQKRLMAAGFEKTYEIGRAYRNEGSSPEHLQEFTNMEFYWAFADYRDGMELSKELYRHLATTVFGTTTFETRGYTVDLADEWKELDYVATVEDMTGVNVLEADEEELGEKLKELGVEYEGDTRERLTDSLWKYCRKDIAGPAFLINHPKLVSPLAKEDPNKPGTVERFQIILAGSEIGNGYSELNNPLEQQKRFDIQRELIAQGDAEAMMPDEEFVEMLEHGMPPTCGFGFGERFFSYLVDKPIRETQLFPLMKPYEPDQSSS